MRMNQEYKRVGGEFSKLFNPEDYMAMINGYDELTSILRGHLILEEVLNLWSSKLTQTDNLYADISVPFKTKLKISKNLGLSEEIYGILNKINEVRNRFAHRRGYELEDSFIESLKSKVDEIIPYAKVNKCEAFNLFVQGKNQEGKLEEITLTWKESDNRIKFSIIFVTLMLKLTQWVQSEFFNRNINYKIIY